MVNAVEAADLRAEAACALPAEAADPRAEAACAHPAEAADRHAEVACARLWAAQKASRLPAEVLAGLLAGVVSSQPQAGVVQPLSLIHI